MASRTCEYSSSQRTRCRFDEAMPAEPELCRENSPALKRIALDSLAQIVAGLGINIKKTDIDLADPAKDDIVSFELELGMRSWE